MRDTPSSADAWAAGRPTSGDSVEQTLHAAAAAAGQGSPAPSPSTHPPPPPPASPPPRPAHPRPSPRPRSKTRGLGAGRKLKIHRRNQRWADKDFKKSHLGSEWKKPFAGASHAKGIVLEKM